MITSERRLLAELVRSYLGSGASWAIHDGPVSTAEALKREVTRLRTTHPGGVTALLLDPLDPAWRDAALELRADERVGILALTARPSYFLQRAWRQRSADGSVRAASGLLSLESDAQTLTTIIGRAFETPADTGAWLTSTVDGDKVPLHPAGFAATPAGREADAIRAYEELWTTLRMAGDGYAKNEIAGELNIEAETVRERLKRCEERLGATTEVQLGRRACEFGLFDDPEHR